MNSAEKMDITRDFFRSKRPCSNGYRWYLKRQEATNDCWMTWFWRVA